MNHSDIEFKVVYSRRRTLGISILPDSSVIVRVPYRTPAKTILKMVEEKLSWIRKHRDFFQEQYENRRSKSYTNGSIHLFRGNEMVLNLKESNKPYVYFNSHSIDMGIGDTESEESIRILLHKAYKTEALKQLPIMFYNIINKHLENGFKPTGLEIRSMKSRWGSCSNKGKITLSSELIRLSNRYIEYIIIHELCHLRHHNHGPNFYELLSGLCPDWKGIRNEMKKFVL